MKRFHPSPALVISLIALFVALGGTSYAAITSLPANSVGTKQLKNSAVTDTKLSAAVLKYFLHVGSTLPSGKTAVGDWGSGGVVGDNGVGGTAYAVSTFTLPLTTGLDADHAIFVSGSSATHCSGVGHADAGYLCVYEVVNYYGATPTSDSIYNPEAPNNPTLAGGTGKNGFGILLSSEFTGGYWDVAGTYAVTAP